MQYVRASLFRMWTIVYEKYGLRDSKSDFELEFRKDIRRDRTIL